MMHPKTLKFLQEYIPPASSFPTVFVSGIFVTDENNRENEPEVVVIVVVGGCAVGEGLPSKEVTVLLTLVTVVVGTSAEKKQRM